MVKDFVDSNDVLKINVYGIWWSDYDDYKIGTSFFFSFSQLALIVLILYIYKNKCYVERSIHKLIFYFGMY